MKKTFWLRPRILFVGFFIPSVFMRANYSMASGWRLNGQNLYRLQLIIRCDSLKSRQRFGKNYRNIATSLNFFDLVGADK
ncbi:MAG: hypothetical protein A2743_02740 [Candidatus Taylorbacteria bacterium RIFCSPHIGHO2_01_FULL_43_47]|nr:MAG: hypothetical protein A2743_02740 [Candidatus Taylorbacteria bacterium RIFCSPHIGHO2_01_FULL_43_47]